MMQLNRPRFSRFRMPGWPTFAAYGVVVVVILFVRKFGINKPPLSGGVNIAGWAVFIGMLIVFASLIFLDNKLYLDRMCRKMTAVGFVFTGSATKKNMLIPFLVDRYMTPILPLARMLPKPIDSESIKRCGILKDTTQVMYVGAAEIRIKRSEKPWIYVATYVKLEVPWFILGPHMARNPAGLQKLKIDDPELARTRSLWNLDDSEKSEILRAIIESTADAFKVQHAPAFSFRHLDDPGKFEQWVYHHGWLVYADQGRLEPGPMIEAVELVLQVAEQLLAAAEILNPKPENEQAAT